MNRRCVHPGYLISLGASLLVLATLVSAQTPPGASNPNTSGRASAPASHTIRGKIFLPSGGLPDQRIRVVLELNTGGIAGETFSDSVGNFEFRSIPSNSYRVTVPTDNQVYETTQETLEVYGSFSLTFMVQIYLRDKNANVVVRPKGKMLSAAEFTQDVPKEAKKAYELGLKRVKEGKPEEAIGHFQSALKVFPDYLLALNKLGEQYMATHKPADAQATFERAVAVNPKFPLAHINLGMLLVELKNFPEAIEHLEAANRADESYPMAHLFLGRALMEKDPPDLDRAERALLKARESGGNELAYVRLHLFNLYFRRKAYEKAAEQLEAYLKEAPDAPNAASVKETLAKVKKAIAQNANKPSEVASAGPPPPPTKAPGPTTNSTAPAEAKVPEVKPPPALTSGKLAEEACPSVVLLLTSDQKADATQPPSGVPRGSGFFIRPDVIVTNYHLIKGAVQIYAKAYGGQELYHAKILNTDPVNNLALLRIFGKSGPPLSLADNTKIAAGDDVYAIGNLEGPERNVTKGNVSSFRKSGSQEVIQIDVPSSQAISGGPILNSQGKVIGVAVTGVINGQRLSFAVPISYLASLIAATF